jgi:1-deoxy-D-xylulose-5-phosphate reductoisomerase
MELPVLYALTYPDRVEDNGVPPFDPVAASPLTFEPCGTTTSPRSGWESRRGRAGGAAPAVFNAANEIAVARVLDGSLTLQRIPAAIECGAHAPGGDSR